MPELEPDEVARRQFEVGPCLGRGGFGEVYLATMHSAGGLDTTVALKVLRADLDPAGQAVQRLRDEGRLLARLDHPAILKVHDLVVLEGRIGLVTEYVDGEDLDRCAAGGMPRRALLEAVSEVAAALSSAWTSPRPTGPGRMEIVHRDIKPSNIRISKHGGVKLLDFGIARTETMEREAKTRTDLVIGSPGYMAPERFLDDDSEPESDVFALGVTLYEALAGERFYQDLGVLQMSAMALDDERHAEFVRERLEALPNISQPLRRALAACLHHDPGERPPAANLAEALRDLADAAEGEDLVRWARSRFWPAPSRDDGPLGGRTLTEGTRARPVPDATMDLPEPDAGGAPFPEPEAPPRSRTGLLAGAAALGLIAAAGGAVALVGAIVVGVWASGGPSEPATDPTTTVGDSSAEMDATDSPEPPPRDAGAPVEEPPVAASDPAPTPPPPAIAAPTRLETPSPAPPPEPSEAPTPAPAGRVYTQQQTTRIRLKSRSGATEIGDDVPVGRYRVEFFVDGSWRDAETAVSVTEGSAWRVTCHVATWTCDVEPG